MPSYEQVNAQADAEMAAFLAAQNASPSDTPPPAQPDENKPSVNEDDFIDDEDELGGQENPNQQQSYQPSQQQREQTQTQTPTMYTAEQLEYERRLAEERGKNAVLGDMVGRGGGYNQPSQPEVNPYFTDEMLQITPEEMEAFGEETTAFATKVANRTIKRLIDEVIIPMQQDQIRMQNQLNQYGNGMANTSAQMLYNRVQERVPHLRNITQNPEWGKFLQETPAPMSGRGVSLESVFRAHLKSGNVDGIVEIIDAFTQSGGRQMQQQMSPGQSSVGNPPTTLPNRKSKMLSYDKFLEKQRLWQSGMISYEEYAQVEAIYDRAAMEGRVKY